MITFQEEMFKDAWPEFQHLAHAHWNETMKPVTNDEFKPNVNGYIHYNELGIYHLYTARDNGVLVGDMGIYVTPSMHTQKLIATEDSWYMIPAVRSGRVALRFVEYVQNELIKLGVTSVRTTTPPSAGSRRLLEKFFGYKHTADSLLKEF